MLQKSSEVLKIIVMDKKWKIWNNLGKRSFSKRSKIARKISKWAQKFRPIK